MGVYIRRKKSGSSFLATRGIPNGEVYSSAIDSDVLHSFGSVDHHLRSEPSSSGFPGRNDAGKPPHGGADCRRTGKTGVG
ncbi:hypothetical protein D3C86_2026840 [compost metagenome]